MLFRPGEGYLARLRRDSVGMGFVPVRAAEHATRVFFGILFHLESIPMEENAVYRPISRSHSGARVTGEHSTRLDVERAQCV